MHFFSNFIIKQYINKTEENAILDKTFTISAKFSCNKNQFTPQHDGIPKGGEGGGVRVLSYVSHIVMCRPKKVGLLRRFNLKTCIDFGHFDLESVMVFEETTRCMHVFIVAIPNELERKKKYVNSKWILRNLF